MEVPKDLISYYLASYCIGVHICALILLACQLRVSINLAVAEKSYLAVFKSIWAIDILMCHDQSNVIWLLAFHSKAVCLVNQLLS
jgi:hypothetical protein